MLHALLAEVKRLAGVDSEWFVRLQYFRLPSPLGIPLSSINPGKNAWYHSVIPSEDNIFGGFTQRISRECFVEKEFPPVGLEEGKELGRLENPQRPIPSCGRRPRTTQTLVSAQAAQVHSGEMAYLNQDYLTNGENRIIRDPLRKSLDAPCNDPFLSPLTSAVVRCMKATGGRGYSTTDWASALAPGFLSSSLVRGGTRYNVPNVAQLA
jgi:hypothetical protein